MSFSPVSGALAVAFAAALVPAAQAADLPARSAPPAAVFAALDWTGFYAGGNLGVNSHRAAFSDVVNPLAGTAYITIGGTDRFAASRTGLTGGLQAGYNWRLGGMVAGLEADAGFLGGSARRASSVPAALGEVIGETRGGPYGTIRGRLGVTVDRMFVFATGGVIGADTGARVTDAFAPTTLFTNRLGFRAGWTIGAGLEYALGGAWTVKADYLYYDLGKTRISGQINGLPGPVNTFSWDVRSTGHIVRVGLNYWFAAGAPVVARY